MNFFVGRSEARFSLLQFYYIKQIDFIVFYFINCFVLFCYFLIRLKLFYFILFSWSRSFVTWFEFSFSFCFAQDAPTRTLLWLSEWRTLHSAFKSCRWIKFWLSITTNAHTLSHRQSVHLIFDVLCHCRFY